LEGPNGLVFVKPSNFSACLASAALFLRLNTKRINISTIASRAIPPMIPPAMVTILLSLFAVDEEPSVLADAGEDEVTADAVTLIGEDRGTAFVLPFEIVAASEIVVDCALFRDPVAAVVDVEAEPVRIGFELALVEFEPPALGLELECKPRATKATEY
jgi:hypothetical protein